VRKGTNLRTCSQIAQKMAYKYAWGKGPQKVRIEEQLGAGNRKCMITTKILGMLDVSRKAHEKEGGPQEKGLRVKAVALRGKFKGQRTQREPCEYLRRGLNRVIRDGGVVRSNQDKAECTRLGNSHQSNSPARLGGESQREERTIREKNVTIWGTHINKLVAANALLLKKSHRLRGRN